MNKKKKEDERFKEMNNYVQLNNLLDNEVAAIIAALCFTALIFAMGSVWEEL